MRSILGEPRNAPTEPNKWKLAYVMFPIQKDDLNLRKNKKMFLPPPPQPHKMHRNHDPLFHQQLVVVPSCGSVQAPGAEGNGRKSLGGKSWACIPFLSCH